MKRLPVLSRMLLFMSMVLASLQPARAQVEIMRLNSWHFFEGVGTDRTPFCGLEARQEQQGQMLRAVNIRSFVGKPMLSVDFVDTSWTMQNHSQVNVLFGAGNARPLTLSATAFPQVLDMALPVEQTPALFATIDTTSPLQIDFPDLDSPSWLVLPSYNPVEVHKFIRCRTRQPRGRL